MEYSIVNLFHKDRKPTLGYLSEMPCGRQRVSQFERAGMRKGGLSYREITALVNCEASSLLRRN